GVLMLNASGLTSKVNELVFNGAGKLDLMNNSLVVQASASDRLAVLDEIANQIRRSRNSTTRWGGLGLASSTAANDGTRTSAIAAILNDNGSGGVLYTTFFGQPVDINSVLVRYTLNG